MAMLSLTCKKFLDIISRNFLMSGTAQFDFLEDFYLCLLKRIEKKSGRTLESTHLLSQCDLDKITTVLDTEVWTVPPKHAFFARKEMVKNWDSLRQYCEFVHHLDEVQLKYAAIKAAHHLELGSLLINSKNSALHKHLCLLFYDKLSADLYSGTLKPILDIVPVFESHITRSGYRSRGAVLRVKKNGPSIVLRVTHLGCARPYKNLTATFFDKTIRTIDFKYDPKRDTWVNAHLKKISYRLILPSQPLAVCA